MTDRINFDHFDQVTAFILMEWNVHSIKMARLLCRQELKVMCISDEACDVLAEYLHGRGRQFPQSPAIIGLVGREQYGSSWEIPVQLAFIQLNLWVPGCGPHLLGSLNRLLEKDIFTVGDVRRLSFGELRNRLGQDHALLLTGWMSGAGLFPPERP